MVKKKTKMFLCKILKPLKNAVVKTFTAFYYRELINNNDKRNRLANTQNKKKTSKLNRRGLVNLNETPYTNFCYSNKKSFFNVNYLMDIFLENW